MSGRIKCVRDKYGWHLLREGHFVIQGDLQTQEIQLLSQFGSDFGFCTCAVKDFKIISFGILLDEHLVYLPLYAFLTWKIIFKHKPTCNPRAPCLKNSTVLH